MTALFPTRREVPTLPHRPDGDEGRPARARARSLRAWPKARPCWPILSRETDDVVHPEAARRGRPAGCRGRSLHRPDADTARRRSRRNSPAGARARRRQRVLAARLPHPAGDREPDQRERHVVPVVPAGQRRDDRRPWAAAPRPRAARGSSGATRSIIAFSSAEPVGRGARRWSACGSGRAARDQPGYGGAAGAEEIRSEPGWAPRARTLGGLVGRVDHLDVVCRRGERHGRLRLERPEAGAGRRRGGEPAAAAVAPASLPG